MRATATTSRLRVARAPYAEVLGADRVQLEELAGVVLVDVALEVHVVVEVEQHRGASGALEDELGVRRQRLLVADLAQERRPEQDLVVLERVGVVDVLEEVREHPLQLPPGVLAEEHLDLGRDPRRLLAHRLAPDRVDRDVVGVVAPEREDVRVLALDLLVRGRVRDQEPLQLPLEEPGVPAGVVLVRHVLRPPEREPVQEELLLAHQGLLHHALGLNAAREAGGRGSDQAAFQDATARGRVLRARRIGGPHGVPRHGLRWTGARAASARRRPVPDRRTRRDVRFSDPRFFGARDRAQHRFAPERRTRGSATGGVAAPRMDAEHSRG